MFNSLNMSASPDYLKLADKPTIIKIKKQKMKLLFKESQTAPFSPIASPSWQRHHTTGDAQTVSTPAQSKMNGIEARNFIGGLRSSFQMEKVEQSNHFATGASAMCLPEINK